MKEAFVFPAHHVNFWTGQDTMQPTLTSITISYVYSIRTEKRQEAWLECNWWNNKATPVSFGSAVQLCSGLQSKGQSVSQLAEWLCWGENRANYQKLLNLLKTSMDKSVLWPIGLQNPASEDWVSTFCLVKASGKWCMGLTFCDASSVHVFIEVFFTVYSCLSPFLPLFASSLLSFHLISVFFTICLVFWTFNSVISMLPFYYSDFSLLLPLDFLQNNFK